MENLISVLVQILQKLKRNVRIFESFWNLFKFQLENLLDRRLKSTIMNWLSPKKNKSLIDFKESCLRANTMGLKTSQIGSCLRNLMVFDVFGQEKWCWAEMEIHFILQSTSSRIFPKMLFWMESCSLIEDNSKKQFLLLDVKMRMMNGRTSNISYSMGRIWKVTSKTGSSSWKKC